MLNSCSLLQSSIPNNAGPLPDTTKKLHQNLMLLLLMLTLHTSICGMQEWL